uniref:Uncharacterized protein n=1 Tax=Onchocerca volvulus TaxID=6282 RepID=A0A8R1Y1T1_ONCVO
MFENGKLDGLFQQNRQRPKNTSLRSLIILSLDTEINDSQLYFGIACRNYFLHCNKFIKIS